MRGYMDKLSFVKNGRVEAIAYAELHPSGVDDWHGSASATGFYPDPADPHYVVRTIDGRESAAIITFAVQGALGRPQTLIDIAGNGPRPF